MYRELLGCSTADLKQKCQNVGACTDADLCCLDDKCLQDCINSDECMLHVGPLSTQAPERGTYNQLVTVGMSTVAKEDNQKNVSLTSDVQLHWCASMPHEGGCLT